ncbi:hypothetical protein FXO37_01281 [Capsicum annuum]|nr:hypothetical protein FXO37_01281 [Capsicum annuum]
MGNPVVQHSFHEANQVADILSRLGSHLPHPGNDHILFSPPVQVVVQPQRDASGVLSSRIITWSMFNMLLCFRNEAISTSLHVPFNAKPSISSMSDKASTNQELESHWDKPPTDSTKLKAITTENLSNRSSNHEDSLTVECRQREVGHDSRKGSFEMSTIMRGVYEKPINGKILPFELRSCASKSSSKADEAQNNPAPR